MNFGVTPTTKNCACNNPPPVGIAVWVLEVEVEMFASALVLSSLIGAAAFAPASKITTSRTLSMAFAGGLAGSEGPELRNFDPLRFSEKSPEWVPWFRESELKHGRIAMLATAGIIVAGFVRLPGDVFQEGTVLEAHNNMVKSGAMIQILGWVGLIELLTIPALKALGTSDRQPGNYSFDPLGFGKNAAAFKKYEQNELKNGRLAMLAFSGIITQAALTGKEFPWPVALLHFPQGHCLNHRLYSHSGNQRIKVWKPSSSSALDSSFWKDSKYSGCSEDTWPYQHTCTFIDTTNPG
eukprot:gene8107-16647_t